MQPLLYIHTLNQNQNQNVKIHDVFSSFQTLLSGVPQFSALGPILCNVLFNDLVAVLKKSQLNNFADDNAISQEANSADDLLKILKKESEPAVKWFRENNMIGNPDRFQVIVLQKEIKNNINITLNIENITIDTLKSVKLFGITINSKLNFEKHISVFCRKKIFTTNPNLSFAKIYSGKKKKRGNN